jgi:cytochrome c oxidase subunit 2
MKSISSKLAALLLNLGRGRRLGQHGSVGCQRPARRPCRAPAQPAPAVTKIAEEQHWLHNFMLILCTVIFIAVFAVMFYSIWKHRKSVGHKPANFHESVTVEIIWTIIPFIIVILMALPATKVLVAQGHHQCRPDHQGHRLPVEVGLRLPQGRGRGHLAFISTLDSTHREMSNNGAKGDRP